MSSVHVQCENVSCTGLKKFCQGLGSAGMLCEIYYNISLSSRFFLYQFLFLNLNKDSLVLLWHNKTHLHVLPWHYNGLLFYHYNTTKVHGTPTFSIQFSTSSEKIKTQMNNDIHIYLGYKKTPKLCKIKGNLTMNIQLMDVYADMNQDLENQWCWLFE